MPSNQPMKLTGACAPAAYRHTVRQSSGRGCSNLSGGREVTTSLGRGPSSRRGSTDCDAEVSFGDCAGAALPVAKTVAALVGPSALGWMTSPAGNDGARNSALRRRSFATMRGRSSTTIGFVAEEVLVREFASATGYSEGLASRLDVVEHADEADEGRSALLRRLPSRGRAAF